MKYFAETYDWYTAIMKMQPKKSNLRHSLGIWSLNYPDVEQYIGENEALIRHDIVNLFHEYHLKKFCDVISHAGLHKKECKIVFERYAVFPQHRCFNIKGNEITCGIINVHGKTYWLRAIYNDVFNEQRHHDSEKYRVKLTSEDVKQIRNLNKLAPCKYTPTEIGRLFNISKQQACNIINNKVWKGV